MPQELDPLESRVHDALAALCSDPAEKTWGRREWTRNVTRAVGAAMRQLGYTWYATEPKNQEWMWDGVAWEQSGGWVLNQPLVLESQWDDKEDVEDDFQRLMVARADHRVLVFEAYTQDDADIIVKECIHAVGAYRGTAAGDRYLFACWLADNRFYFRLHVV